MPMSTHFPEYHVLAESSSVSDSTRSPPASPRSTASLPSPPSSPHPREKEQLSTPASPSSLASDIPLSSLSSSLFLSETSSPVVYPAVNEDSSSKTLIIPSLTIPPSHYDAHLGEPIGNVKLWVIGHESLGCRALAESLVVGSPVIADRDEWTVSSDGFPLLRASTSVTPNLTRKSFEHQPYRNVEIYAVEFSGIAEDLLDSLLRVLHRPFIATDRLLNDSEPSSTSFVPLLTSNTSVLHTAMIYVSSTHTQTAERSLILELSAHIPLIPAHDFSDFLPNRRPLSHRRSTRGPLPPATLSLFRPPSLQSLQETIFQSSTLYTLRTEAAERFLRWRDLNAALRQLSPSPSSSVAGSIVGSGGIPRRRARANTARVSSSSLLGIPFVDSISSTSPPAINDWMWNWEARFSRDVKDEQTRAAMRGTEGIGEDAAAAINEPPDSPSAAVERSRHGLELPNEHRPDSISNSSHGDPLHLRSVARLALSLIPAITSKYIFRSLARAAEPPSQQPTRRHGGSRWDLSWSVFGLGVGVGVAVSLCVYIGLGFRIQH